MPDLSRIKEPDTRELDVPRPLYYGALLASVAVFVASLLTGDRLGLWYSLFVTTAAWTARRLHRQARYDAAIMAIIVPMLLLALLGGWTRGALRPVTMVGMFGAVIMAGIYVGRRALAATMAAAAAVYGLLILAQRWGWTHERPITPSWVQWLTPTMTLMLLGLAVHYAREVAIAAMKIQAEEIAERRAAETEARAAEERLRLSMEATRQGWFDLDVRSGSVQASPQFLDMVNGGLPTAPMTFDTWIASVHAEDRAAVLREFTACLQSDRAYSLDYRLRMRTGEWRWIRSIAKVSTRDVDGAPLRLTGTHADITQQREAEAALAESEARYRALVDSTATALVVHRAGRFVYVNPSAVRLLGASSADDMVGRSVLDIVHPDDRAMVMSRIRSAEAEGKAAPLVPERLMRLDGAPLMALVQNQPIMFEGQPAVQVTCLDITERHRAETRLRESERELTLITDTVPGFLAHLDTELRYLRVNRRYEEGVGLTSAALRGRSVREVFGETDWAKVRPHLERALTGETVEFETRMSLPGLHNRWVRRRATPAFDEHGRVRSLVVFGEDITAEKERDQALLRAAEEFRGMLAATTDAFLVVGIDGRVVEVNDAALQLLGYARDELVGKAYGAVDVTPFRDHAAVLSTEQGATREALFARKDGTQFFADVSSTFVASSARTLCFVRDTSERRRVEELRLRSQKLESLGTLAGGIAHDFNNILSAIRGNVELARDALSADPDGAAALEEIEKAGGRATELVRRITAFGRPKPPSRELVHLPHVLGEVLRLLRPATPSRVALNVHDARDLPPVLADASQVHEALVNLTTNAAHAIGATAGAIEYRFAVADPTADECARLRLAPGRYVRLSVADTGCGMDESTIARIFDVFYTTKEPGEGTGLGLSMVYGIMQSHDGAVAVDSSVGAGATFHLYFPVASASAVRDADRARETATPAAPPQRVLFIDDEEPLVRLAERTLRRHGHAVRGFCNPVEALRVFRDAPGEFDLVITDLSMPHLTGLDVVRDVRQIRPNVPVVMITGYLTDVDEAAAHAAGVVEILDKASAVQHLDRAVNRVYASARA